MQEWPYFTLERPKLSRAFSITLHLHGNHIALPMKTDAYVVSHKVELL